MPTYEYECTACGHRFELFEKMADRPTRLCPKCHKRKATRRITGGAGVIFKGSGFYATEYGRSKGAHNESAPKDKKSTTRKKADKEGS